jgi:hypothetical protein
LSLSFFTFSTRFRQVVDGVIVRVCDVSAAHIGVLAGHVEIVTGELLKLPPQLPQFRVSVWFDGGRGARNGYGRSGDGRRPQEAPAG